MERTHYFLPRYRQLNLFSNKCRCFSTLKSNFRISVFFFPTLIRTLSLFFSTRFQYILCITMAIKIEFLFSEIHKNSSDTFYSTNIILIFSINILLKIRFSFSCDYTENVPISVRAFPSNIYYLTVIFLKFLPLVKSFDHCNLHIKNTVTKQ